MTPEGAKDRVDVCQHRWAWPIENMDGWFDVNGKPRRTLEQLAADGGTWAEFIIRLDEFVCLDCGVKASGG